MHDVVGDRAGIDRFAMQLEHAGLGHRERPEVVEQPGHHDGLVQQRAEPLGVDRIEAVEHALHRSADHLQGRAQFVRDVRQHLAPSLLVRLEALGHLVEGVGETSELARLGVGHARREVAAGDAFGRIHQRADRSGVPPQPPDAERRARPERRWRRPP